jgi:hypothetical protein
MVVNGIDLHVHMLLKMVEHKWKTFAHTCSQSPHFCHLETLKWARGNGCEWDRLTCIYAAEKGHLETLKWARENGCEWNEWVCHYAAKN